MRDVVLGVDPGQTTGWALVRRRDRATLGLGDLAPEDVGCGLDLLVRSMHRLGYTVVPVVEQMPTPAGTGGHLAIELEFVRRTVDHWLVDIFELPVTYVLPGTWKTSAVAKTIVLPSQWNCLRLSQHMKDAYTMANFYMRKR